MTHEHKWCFKWDKTLEIIWQVCDCGLMRTRLN